MIQINLTPQETVILFGFMKGVLEKVHATPDLELHDRENTTALLESILDKVAREVETSSKFN